MELVPTVSGTVRIRLLDDQENILLVLENGGPKRKTSGELITKISAFGLPGGRIHSEETPLEAASRELLEETGYKADINPEPIIIKKNDEGYSIFLFHARNPQKVQTITSKDNDILSLIWLNWKMAYGRLPFENKEYPIYHSHESLIHIHT